MIALGDSGLSIGPLVLGGNVFGFTADRAASFTVLDAFVAHGGGMIDTADVYSAWVPGHKGGESETMIGAWLAESGQRGAVTVATKVGMMAGGLSPDAIAAGIDGSLARLGIDRIDLYYAHKDDDSVALEDVMAAFARVVDSGKARAIGASNFSAERLAEANAIADRIGAPRFTVMQPEYNLVARDDFEGGLQALAVDANLPALPYFGLASGFLTGKYRSKDDLSQSKRGGAVAKYLGGNGPAILVAMDAVAAETGASHAQVALAWLAAQPGVAAPIASATSVAQLDELMGFAAVALSEAQLRALTAAA